MPKAASDEERVQFGERVCFRLDKDAREVLNAMSIKWTSQGHAMNAFIRRAVKKVVPDGMALEEHPFDKRVLNDAVLPEGMALPESGFDEMALDGPPTKIKRLMAKKRKARK